MNLTSARLTALRAELAPTGAAFLLVPSSDAHQSEYVPAPWQRRAWLTGFTGSMGSAVIGLDHAWLWVDSRYWLQAEREVDTASITVMRLGAPDVPNIPEFLAIHAGGRSVAYDPQLHTPNEILDLRAALTPKHTTLTPTPSNLVDRIWHDRPTLPTTPITPWPARYSGRTTAEKLAALRADLATLGADHLVATTLDEIAWLFDIRSSDVAFTPVAIAWALVSATSATLFTDPAKLTPATSAHLAEAGIATAPYAAFGPALATLQGAVLIDPNQANQWVLTQVEAAADARPLLQQSPVQLARAIKSTQEIQGMRAAHVRDGVAVSRFLAWLDDHWRGLTEVTAADRLAAFRAEGADFVDLSFDTIAGYADHGAIVHYHAHPSTAHALDDQAILLIDSGAQYRDGTTDITRTVHLGTPTDLERTHYTLVLRGHLALGRQPFPHGTTGTQLDGFARAPLWDHALNYGHGTGHGVGCFLSVHQGPHRIAPGPNTVALVPGMIVSNEPGLYLAGRYGIRIENLCVITDITPPEPAFGRFYRLDDLTLVPYCRKLIDPRQLTSIERAQVDAYHSHVRAALLPLLAPDDEATRRWLIAETAPLDPQQSP